MNSPDNCFDKHRYRLARKSFDAKPFRWTKTGKPLTA